MRKLDTKKVYYTYILRNPLSGSKAFYVGKGKGNRMYKHEHKTRNHNLPNGSNGYLYREIKSILQCSGSIEYEVANDNMTEEEAFALEACYIQEYGIENLCNVATPGLDWGLSKGTNGYKHTKENVEYFKHTGLIGRAKQEGMTVEQLQQRTRKKALQKDLKLLNNVINGIRSKLLKKERQELQAREKAEKDKKQDMLLKGKFIVCDKVNGIYERYCPKCNKVLSYNTWQGFYRACEKSSVCVCCSNSLYKGRGYNHVKITNVLQYDETTR